jgi:hypothetical protein
MNRSAFIILLVIFVPNVWANFRLTTAGEMVYRQGLLPSGKPLSGQRDAEGTVEGYDAACVNCHRRSGLGSAEGQIRIPPITGKYLFSQSVGSAAGNGSDKRITLPSRKVYTDASLARAIREGIGADGRSLNYLMPRYKLDDATLASLVAYLKGLSVGPVPGVSDDTLHFATIITPDADPIKRQGMLDVMQRFFATKSNLIGGESRRMQTSRQIMYRVARKWQLHVWELTGLPETWSNQLRTRLAAEPVFAVISGLGGGTWRPVHKFCEEESIPCLLPNTDVPMVAEQDFYTIYFSQGVKLEADLISRQLQGNRERLGLRRIIQVFRQGDVGETAAEALQSATAAMGLEIVNRPLKTGEPQQSMADVLQDINIGDALILWLRSEDLKALPVAADKSPAIFISGIMGGLEEAPLPASWRKISRMAYPFDLPDLRKVRMSFPLGWFKIQQIPIVDERIQFDTFLACGILAETLDHMQDSFVRDFLVERVESMLGKKPTTGYYPRMGLAPGQRFASKGGYLVHFTEPNGPRIAPDSDWTTP